ncbi:MAG TPA: hypothetical protein VN886_05255 [Acidimicrobiales bacterium]|jgi:hypothetical protein|nr:hypothetical protein [Acidimicrobiales bacterium]
MSTVDGQSAPRGSPGSEPADLGFQNPSNGIAKMPLPLQSMQA